MARNRKNRPSAAAAPRSFEYRGKTIEIVPSREMSILRIDGQEIVYEQTEEGVYSHSMAHKLYGSPDELAEDLVRQWGNAAIDHHESEMGGGSPMPRRPKRRK